LTSDCFSINANPDLEQDVLDQRTVISGSPKIEAFRDVIYEMEGTWPAGSAKKCSYSSDSHDSKTELSPWFTAALDDVDFVKDRLTPVETPFDKSRYEFRYESGFMHRRQTPPVCTLLTCRRLCSVARRYRGMHENEGRLGGGGQTFLGEHRASALQRDFDSIRRLRVLHGGWE
jgi:hypothetical protein